MKSFLFLLCLTGTVFFRPSPANAEYNKAILNKSLGECLAFCDAVEIITSSECSTFFAFDSEKYNLQEEAQKYYSVRDYEEFENLLHSNPYRKEKMRMANTIIDGIEKMKGEGIPIEKICSDLMDRAETSFDRALEQWNEDKVKYGYSSRSKTAND